MLPLIIAHCIADLGQSPTMRISKIDNDSLLFAHGLCHALAGLTCLFASGRSLQEAFVLASLIAILHVVQDRNYWQMIRSLDLTSDWLSRWLCILIDQGLHLLAIQGVVCLEIFLDRLIPNG